MTPRYAVPLPAVDRVDVLDHGPGLRLRAHKTVTAEDPYLAGHFPGRTMLPAVFLLEVVRQAVSAATDGRQVELLEIRSARLLRPMLAGDEIVVTLTGERQGDDWLLTADCASSTGAKVATATVLVGPARHATSADDTVHERRQWADHAAVRAMLPVRHPMVLVDRVTSLCPGREIHAVKAVSGSEPCYQALPDDAPSEAFAYPRSLALESFGQAAALLCLFSEGVAAPGDLLMLGAIRNCRFTGSVHPGDVLRLIARLDQVIVGNAFVNGEIWADDRRLATIGELIAVSRPHSPNPKGANHDHRH